MCLNNIFLQFLTFARTLLTPNGERQNIKQGVSNHAKNVGIILV